MMRRITIILAITVAILTVVMTPAATQLLAENPGGASPLFLSGAGGRGLGMGGANVALANDPSGVFWNPATLIALPEREIGFMHLPLPEGSSYDFAAIGWPTVDYGSFAAAAFLLQTDEIQRRDENGRLLGDFSANQQMYLLGYGVSINRFLALGATVKLFGHNIDNTSAFAAGGDIGMRVAVTERFMLGLNVQNVLAPRLTLASDEEELPMTMKAGAGVILPFSDDQHTIALEIDVDKTDNLDPVFHAGAEVGLFNRYFLRGGYDVDQINIGGGLRVGPAQVGYTFRTQDYFDAQHRISLNLSFGGSIESILAERRAQQREAAEQFAKEQREQELNNAVTQARYYYQNGMYDSAEVYYAQVYALTSGGDTEALERLSEIDEEQTRTISENVRAGVLRESDSLKAAQLFSDLNEALNVRDFAAVEVLLDRLRPAFGSENRFKQAEAEFNLLTSSRIEELLTEARRLEARADYAEAAIRYNRILDLNPTDEDARNRLNRLNRRIAALELLREGVTAFNVGDTATARTQLQQLVAINPQDSLALRLLARMDAGSSEPVTSSLAEIQNDSEMWQKYLKGIEQFRAENYEEAIRLWEQVLLSYPGNPETEKNIRQAKLRLESHDTTN